MCPSLLRPLLKSVETLVIALVMVSTTVAVSPPARPRIDSVAVPVRDHHLFVGVDLFLPNSGKLDRVRTVTKRASVIEKEDGRMVQDKRRAGFAWKKMTKVAPVIASIDDLQAKRVFSVGNNPQFERDSREANLTEYFTMRRDTADQMFRFLEARVDQVARGSAEGEHTASAEQLVKETFSEAANAQVELRRYSTNVAPADSALVEGERAPYDGVVHEFTLSSTQPIAEAFAVVMIRVRDAEGALQDINYSKEIGALGSEPRPIRLAQFGLPLGFELLDTEIHLYSRGEEIPSNLSDRHMPLSKKDACEFVLMSHLADHRAGDAPATVVWSLAPAQLRAEADVSRFDHAVVVHVDDRGQLIGIEETESRIVPNQVRAVVEALTYLPRIQQGQAVAGTLTVNPSDYFR